MRPNLAFAYDPGRTRHLFDAEGLARLDACTRVLSSVPIDDFSDASQRRLLAETEVLVTGWGCPMINMDVLRAAPKLQLIAHAAGTVKFMIDPEAYSRGIRVTHAAAANAVPVAEFTLATILLANKRVFEMRDLYRADPTRRSTYRLMDEPIGNFRRSIGVIGASRIGRKVIELLAGFDFSILLYDPFVRPDDPVAARAELVDLDTLMARSDVVSVHAPSLPSTRAMVGSRQLKLMQDGATLINTARGALVDEAALLAELGTGRIQAVIDVTDPEIPPPDSPFFSLPNVFLTPHLAGAIGTERLRLGLMAIEEVERFARGEPLLHEIEPSLLERLA
jgi:phosphoglycerate dehydrogenase-like enzyme